MRGFSLSTDMKPVSNTLERIQRDICKTHNSEFVSTPLNTKLGFAVQTLGKLPINGLRHPLQGDTNGWYIWCGEELGSDPDFFSPLHASHLKEPCPEVL